MTVVDTVGAGDTYMTALIDQIAERRSRAVVGARELEQLGAWAATAAAITVQRHGADLPTEYLES